MLTYKDIDQFRSNLKCIPNLVTACLYITDEILKLKLKVCPVSKILGNQIVISINVPEGITTRNYFINLYKDPKVDKQLKNYIKEFIRFEYNGCIYTIDMDIIDIDITHSFVDDRLVCKIYISNVILR